MRIFTNLENISSTSKLKICLKIDQPSLIFHFNLQANGVDQGIGQWGSGQGWVSHHSMGEWASPCTCTWNWLGCGEPPSFGGGAKLGQGVCPRGWGAHSRGPKSKKVSYVSKELCFVNGYSFQWTLPGGLLQKNEFVTQEFIAGNSYCLKC